ncbi:MAG: cupredoxin domain-containing protein [Acidobacteriota bacterium]
MKHFLLVLLFAACAQQKQPAAQQQPAPSPAPAAQTPAAPTLAEGIQEHTIDVAGEFTPASVTLKAGQPARLHFRRGDKATCADEIVFPDLNIRKKIAANQTVTIDVPAQQARTLRFACGMDMMRGTVVVQ